MYWIDNFINHSTTRIIFEPQNEPNSDRIFIRGRGGYGHTIGCKLIILTNAVEYALLIAIW